MNYWKIREDFDEFDDEERGFGMREKSRDYEKGYKEGCRHGYEKAMREMEQGGEDDDEEEMGERYQADYRRMGYRGEGGGSGMGERRRRRSNGRFY